MPHIRITYLCQIQNNEESIRCNYKELCQFIFHVMTDPMAMAVMARMCVPVYQPSKPNKFNKQYKTVISLSVDTKMLFYTSFKSSTKSL